MTEPTPEATPEPTPPPETDWQSKFTAQQKVNRDLETKLNELRDGQKQQLDALAKAFGVAPEQAGDTSNLTRQIDSLREQFTATQHDNLVLLVARDNGITEQDDIDLLRAVKDEAVMRGLAARIATPAPTGPRPPRPNPTQGLSGSSVPENPRDAFARILGGITA